MKRTLSSTALLVSLLLITTCHIALSQSAAPSDPDDIYWDEDFGKKGPDNASLDCIGTGGGSVYAAGDFSMIDGVAAQNIARWDGTTWHPLGDGILGDPWYMTVDGNDVYVSGFVYRAGDDYANGIAWWDGNTWHSLGDGADNGVDGLIYKVLPDGDNVYVGGRFDRAGNGFDTTGTLLNNLARWNKKTNDWHPVTAHGQAGISGSVLAMAMDNGLLFVGGQFDTAGTTPTQSLAVWDTHTNSWSSIGNVRLDTTRGIIRSMVVHDGYLYIAGAFDMIGTVPAHSIARWHIASGTWSAIGADSIMGEDAYINTIIWTSDGFYFAGDFDRGKGDSAVHIAHWDGNAWGTLPAYSTTPGSVAGDDRGIYGVGGPFTYFDNASDLLMWNGNTWNPVAHTSGSSSISVDALAPTGDDIYVAGRFSEIGGVSLGFGDLARWNRISGKWSSLRSDTTQDLIASTQHVLYPHGSQLYVGGYLYRNDGGTNGIAAWNSNNKTWDRLNEGVNGFVTALQAQGDKVYVGGEFDSAGGQPALGMAIWDETNRSWSSLGLETIAGVTDVGVQAMVVGNNEVYLAGYVTTWAGSGYGIIRWRMDGSAEPYDILALDMNGSINAMTLLNGELYVGGSFTELAGVRLNYLARWDGTDWQPVGNNGSNGVNGTVNAFVERNGMLYIGGSFDSAGTAVAHNIARWDGSAWDHLGSGTNAGVRTIAATPQELFLGGNFLMAGEKQALHIARWTGGAASVDLPQQQASASILVHPNPVAAHTTVSFSVAHAGRIRLDILNTLGEVVTVLDDELVQPGIYTREWHTSELPAGTYFCRLRTGNSTQVTHIQIVR